MPSSIILWLHNLTCVVNFIVQKFGPPSSTYLQRLVTTFWSYAKYSHYLQCGFCYNQIDHSIDTLASSLLTKYNTLSFIWCQLFLFLRTIKYSLIWFAVSGKVLMIALPVTGVVVLIALGCCIYCCCCRRKKKRGYGGIFNYFLPILFLGSFAYLCGPYCRLLILFL